MATRKTLDALLVQARRIAEHCEAGAEREIRKTYRALLKELQSYIAELHVRFADGDDRLDYAALQKAGYDARYLEEIEERIGVASADVAAQLHELVSETYRFAYESMVQGVRAQGRAPLAETFEQSIAITPEQIARAVDNPIMELALEKNHRDIVYEIKQAVATGLMNGDRYSTVARRMSAILDADKGAYRRAVRIARTETHRVREAGNNDAAVRVDDELKAGDSGLRMVKTWRTMKDERVRPQRRRKRKSGWTARMGKDPNHIRLDGQTVLADEDFDLGDGHTAPAPGMSGIAGHDINCRCRAIREVMDDAEFFSRTGRHLPGWEEREKLDDTVEKPAGNGIIETGGAVREAGAYNDENDPYRELRDAHAKKYYEAIRNSDKSAIVRTISNHTGFEKEMVDRAITHAFYTKHNLDKGFDYFDESYEMAESVRRLRLGVDIQPHDLILIQHEAHEAALMESGMEYVEAHCETEKLYNYRIALDEFNQRIRKG